MSKIFEMTLFRKSAISNIFDTKSVHIDTISVGHIDVIRRDIAILSMWAIFEHRKSAPGSLFSVKFIAYDKKSRALSKIR